MEYTDVFTSEDDGLRRTRLYGHARPYVCPTTPSRKLSINSRARQTMKTSIHTGNVTNLIDAVSINNFDKVKELIKAGHNLLLDKDGKSPIHLAAENGQLEILKYLLQAFPMYNVNTPDNFDSTPLHKAASIGQIDIIQVLLERGAQVNIQDSMSLFTPLHLAVQGGHNQTTRNLIKYGADITAQNRFGDTPLHTGVRYGHAGVSRILISVSFDINQPNQNGDTALHIAAALKRRKITKLLVEAGANTEIKNIQNETPLNVAVKKNHLEIIEILKSSNYTPPQKTVSFLQDNGRENFSVQSRHISIPNEMCTVVKYPEQKHSRAKSQSPHEKTKPAKKPNIVKGIFSRKKKDKSEKSEKSSKKPKEEIKPIPPLPVVNKSILCTNPRRQTISRPCSRQEETASPTIMPISGVVSTYHAQTGNQLFKDLAGNIKQGPIGYMPIPNNSTCTCTQFFQNKAKRASNQFYSSNVCMDHGYIDYHGSLNHSSIKPYADGSLLSRFPDKSKDNAEPEYVLTKAKSDESLNQSEHKSRMQEERIKQAINAAKHSPVKGRKQNMDTANNWNFRQNSLIRPVKLDPYPSKISVQVSNNKIKDGKESRDLMRSTMRPSPDGQTDSMTTPIAEHPRVKLDWKPGKYRPDKIILPPSKV